MLLKLENGIEGMIMELELGFMTMVNPRWLLVLASPPR